MSGWKNKFFKLRSKFIGKIIQVSYIKQGSNMHIKRDQANPFNWTGSKFRYLKEYLETLKPLMDKEGIKVLDVFTGGGDCFTKLPSSWKIVANDLDANLIGLHKAFQEGEITREKVEYLYNKRSLSKVNEAAFLKLREDYNSKPDPLNLYLLITNSFNNQMRFSSKGFNMPFGKNRSTFNSIMKRKVDNYIKVLSERDVTFTNKDCFSLSFEDYDLLILDPPYSNTTATYNESTGWDENSDKLLFDKIEKSGKNFVYFNQVVAKGKVNNTLKDWCSNYKVIELKNTTKNCSYHKLNKGKEDNTVEIIVTNI